MTAQIIYGTDFKAKAEKEREEAALALEASAVMARDAILLQSNPIFVAPEKDPA